MCCIRLPRKRFHHVIAPPRVDFLPSHADRARPQPTLWQAPIVVALASGHPVSTSQCLDLFSVLSLLSPVAILVTLIEPEDSNDQLKSAWQDAALFKARPLHAGFAQC